MLIDTHTHLYLSEFDTDREEIMQRAIDAGVKNIYLPAIDSGETARMLDMELKYPEACKAMMGLHPCSVKENYQDELSLVKEWLSKRRFAAIGEIGLDFYWDKTFTAQQFESFHQQVELSLVYNLPIVIHTRSAMRQTIDVVKEYLTKGVRGIFHCFGDSYEHATEIIDMGFYLGIGGVVTYKKSGLAEVIAKIDLKHIVLETDSPYLTPLPFRGKRNESSYIKYVAQKISEIKNVSYEEVAEITTANANKVFK